MKVIYYYSQLNIGGAERSTIRLVNYFARHGWNVTLLLRWDSGLLEHEIDNNVKKIYLKRERSSRAFGRLGDFVWQVLQTGLCKFRENKLKKEEYDIAINGLLGYNPSIVLKKLSSKAYFQMLRNDVSKTGDYGKTEKYLSKYGRDFDAYVGVSQYTTKSFQDKYPELGDRAFTVYNFLAEFDPNKKWDKPAEYTDNAEVRILTIGRIDDKAKGVFRMVNVAARLVEQGITNFKWYVVGNGQDKQALVDKIKSCGIDDYMVTCSGTDIVEPYYQHSDLVAVLSYYEGLCGVVNEAQMMNKCVIATQFSGINEQIITEKNGIIVENTEDAIVDGMQKLLENPSSIKRMSINGLPEVLRNNQAKMQAFEELFNECISKNN